MATNKQVREIRAIAKKWGVPSNSLNRNPVRIINIFRGWFQDCELPFTLMTKEIQEWLETNEVSYKFEPEYSNDEKFVSAFIIIE